MKGRAGLIIGGALFKKKRMIFPPSGDESKTREAAIRKKVVDDYRSREDAIREREAALASRDEELKRNHAELAQRLQELAVSGGGPKGAPEYPPSDGGVPAPDAKSASTAKEQEQLIKKLEEELEKARARHREMALHERKKGEYLVRLMAYKSKGYSVARLQAVMGKDQAEMDRAFQAFANDINALGILAARCDAVDPDFRQDSEALKARCIRPEAIGEIEKGLRELEEKEGAKKKMLMDRVGKWRAEGFATSRFDKLKKPTIGDLEEAIIHFDEDIAMLRKLEERLSGLDKSLEKESFALRSRLKNPDGIRELEREIRALEQGSRAGRPDGRIPEAPAAESPASSAEEEAVKAQIAISENMINDLDAAGIDPTAAANLLRMARSFVRSKNFAKALGYAKKAQETASAMKK